MEDSALQLGDGVTIKEQPAGSQVGRKAKVMLEDSVLQLKVPYGGLTSIAHLRTAFISDETKCEYLKPLGLPLLAIIAVPTSNDTRLSDLPLVS